MALRNTGPVALKHKGPAAHGCTILRPDTPGGFLTASLWAWRPLGRQAHKDAVRNPTGVSGLKNVQPRAAGPLCFRAAGPVFLRAIGP